MIFLSVGSDLPFNRLVKQVDLWSRDCLGQRVVAQVGRLQPSDYVPQAMDWSEMLPAAEFDRHCVECRLMIAHAGMGSIIAALTAGRPIVILPRSARLKETRSDHQFATAEQFATRPGVFVAWTESGLPAVVAEALSASERNPVKTLPAYAPATFTGRLRDFILGNYQGSAD